MKIVQDTKNEVLNRRELIATIEEKTIPSRDEVRAKLATVAQAKENTLIIQKIESSFGNPVVTIMAHAYDDEESMKKTEKEYFLKRNFPVVEKKEAAEAVKEEAKEEVAAPVEEPKAEAAPTEEKKEEAKEEPKAEDKKEEAPATADPAPADGTAEKKKKEGEQ